MIICPKKRFGHDYPINPHKGKLIETVVLKYPDLIYWMAEKDPPHGSEWLPGYIGKCADLFDAKPFTRECARRTCTRTATRFSLYPDSTKPMFWCATCDPEQFGAHDLTVSSRYYDALRHIGLSSSPTRHGHRNVIRSLAEAKGLTGNMTEKKIIQFFYGPDAKPILKDADDENDGV